MALTRNGFMEPQPTITDTQVCVADWLVNGVRRSSGGGECGVVDTKVNEEKTELGPASTTHTIYLSIYRYMYIF